ncbi:MAG: hypothetical protein WCL16_03915 [bacterium]
MNTINSVYLQGEFFGLVVVSLLMPAILYVWLIRKRKVSRIAIVVIAIALIVLSGLDVILIKRLSMISKMTMDISDNLIFASEFSVALYMLPVIMAGIGVNLLTHVMSEHLIIAELEYDKTRKKD